MADTLSNLPERKVSRYRSQRIAATAHNAVDAPPLPQNGVAEQESIARSRSRYRQKSVTAGQNHDRIPVIPEVPQSQNTPAAAPQRRDVSLPRSPPPRRSPSNGVLASPPLRREPSSEQFQSQRSTRRTTSRTTLQSSRSQDSINGNGKQLSNSIDQVTSSPPPRGELFPQPRPEPISEVVKLDGPPASGQIRATKPDEVPGEDKSKSIGLKLFRRKRDKQSTDTSAPPKTPASDDSDAAVSPPADAPVSAVNAGDRKVLMECGTYKMMYSITPSTTPLDLIKSAAITMSDPVNVKSAVLLEYFGSVGVHRAIRRYEHIRDVMNSWDHDTQNSLLLIDPGTSSAETELGLTAVPKTKPAEKSWTMHYSQSVGKWDKRIVNMKRDGQITIHKDAKKPNEQSNVCHLSDFDIYTPTQEKLKKKVRPPKKNCFAIKSQQKSSMFESTENFVHFFCCNEKAVADDFHNSIQAWRSWYLVHVMGEGAPASEPQPSQSRRRAGTAVAAQSPTQRMDNVDDHYQLGTFSSLVDLDQFGISRQSTELPVRSPVRDRFDLPPLNPVQQHVRHPDNELTTGLARRTSVNKHTTNALDRSQTQQRQNSVSQRRNDSAHPRHAAAASQSQGLIAGATNPENGDCMARTSVDYNGLQPRNSVRQGTRMSTDSSRAFTGEGLLAQSQDGWGDGKRGRGVLDGSHADGPMIKLRQESDFVKGSLLQAAELRQGPRGPVLDRERTVEKDVRTGEMF